MTQPLPPYAPLRKAPAREGGLVADLVVGWLLFAMAAVLGVVASFVGAFSMMMTDACPSPADARSTPCDDDRVMAGITLASTAHWLFLVVAFGVMMWLSFRPRPIFWIPLVALLLGAGTFAGGEMLAYSGIPH